MTARTAEIKLTVELDADSLPERIEWEASEADHEGPKPCQAMMLSVWDGENRTTAAIDLWTKDTSVADMNVYFHQVLHRMADTYLRATKDAEVARLIHEFGDKFADAVGLG